MIFTFCVFRFRLSFCGNRRGRGRGDEDLGGFGANLEC